MWLARTSGEWTSVRTGLVSPSCTWPNACGMMLFGSAGGVLMKASQYGSRSVRRSRENGSRTRTSAAFHEAVDVLFERRVVADLTQRHINWMRAVVLGRTPRDSARLDTGLDAAVVAQPPHALVGNPAPEPVVGPLQRPDHDWSDRNRRRPQGVDGQGSPPDVGLGVRANRGARQADIPQVRDDRPQLVAGLPFDLEFLDTVEDLPVRVERDAVRRARLGALATDLAELSHPQVDGFVGDER